jgi:23S rRNA pseudouridine1911/1915/1917 synthase
MNEVKVLSHWQIPADMHGLRADQCLQRRIGRISRARAQRIILAHDFLVDQQAIKPSFRVKSGQKVSLKRFAPDFPTDIDQFFIEKIFENDDLLIVNKPPGLSIHPSANCLYKTLTYWLRKNFPRMKINPCHRLDKETSGIVVCAKNRATEGIIKKSFMVGYVKKTYLAVVDGLVEKSLTISIPLGLQKDRGLVAIKMIKDDDGGKEAITKIRPLHRCKKTNRTLVFCRPLTGRQHQIRAHLSLIGHAIVADKLYGMGDEFFDKLSRGHDEILDSLPHVRHALHAARIQLKLKNQQYIFKSPLPKDLCNLIEMVSSEEIGEIFLSNDPAA